MKSFGCMRNVLIGVVVIILGHFYYQYYNDRHQAKIIPEFYDQTVTITGTLRSMPDERFTTVKLTLQPETINGDSVDSHIYDKVMITTSKPSSIRFGDHITVQGKLEPIESFVTTTGTVFAYDDYLAIRDVYGTMYEPSITVGGRDNGFFIQVRTGLLQLRSYLREHLMNVIPMPESALFSGIMFGDQSLFSPELLDYFRNTGLIHIMVLSGSNIALLALWVGFFFRRFGCRVKYTAMIIGSLLFVMMTGFTAPSVRAWIMLCIGCLGYLLGRQTTMYRVIGLVIVIMFIINPNQVFHDPSFHLSLLATIGVLFIAPKLANYVSTIPERFGLREVVSQTLGVSLLVIPYIAAVMGSFSWVGIVMNIIIVPWIGLLTIGGYGIVIISLFYNGLATLLAFPLYSIAHVIINTVTSIGSKLSVTIVPKFSYLVLTLYYSCVIYVVFYNNSK